MKTLKVAIYVVVLFFSGLTTLMANDFRDYSSHAKDMPVFPKDAPMLSEIWGIYIKTPFIPKSMKKNKKDKSLISSTENKISREDSLILITGLFGLGKRKGINTVNLNWLAKNKLNKSFVVIKDNGVVKFYLKDDGVFINKMDKKNFFHKKEVSFFKNFEMTISNQGEVTCSGNFIYGTTGDRKENITVRFFDQEITAYLKKQNTYIETEVDRISRQTTDYLLETLAIEGNQLKIKKINNIPEEYWQLFQTNLKNERGAKCIYSSSGYSMDVGEGSTIEFFFYGKKVFEIQKTKT